MTSVVSTSGVTPQITYSASYSAGNTTDIFVPFGGVNTSDYFNQTGFSNDSVYTNSSNITVDTGPTRPPVPFEEWQQILIGIVLGSIALSTVIGNSLVCISVAIVKRLQSPSNFLIVSLAVADLFVGMLVMPLAAVVELNGGAWILGPIVCDMWTTTDVLLCTSSILNLCAISVDRYFVITRPFQYAIKRTPKRMGLMVLIVWSLSAVISIPPVFGWKSPHRPFECMISNDIGYQIYATLCAFYLPLIVMICIYFRIWRVSSKIAKSEAKTKIGSFERGTEFQLSRPSHDSGDSNILAVPNGYIRDGNGNGNTEDEGSSEALRRPNPEQLQKRRFTIRSLIPRHPKLSNTKERKATKTLGIIMGCFTLCWLPFFILVLVSTFCVNCVPPQLSSILQWLGYANSFLNPVIYARFNREFRTPFKEILLFRCYGINTRMRSESYVEQYGPVASHRDSLRPTDTIVRYNSQGQTVVALGNGSVNGSRHSESKI
ncbi:5-hydroxytryptamine receptor 1-like [Physella acuta]|uniref:5-hydroxytryptamine receptor 1-like n=1 Tax=Physella acuta TaxID=109671 RepID=UPI0027DB61DD|nr:5-hydroxytryptamine receptor 1-like [Physella acuta]